MAAALKENPETIAGDDGEILQEVTSYLPLPPVEHTPMTDEEAQQVAEKIYARVFTFKQPRSRWSQLMYELIQVHGHPDEGTILRHLYRIMPENGLGGPVRTAIVELAKEKAGEK